MATIRRKTNRQTEVIELLRSSGKVLSADDVPELLSVKINKVSIYRMLSRCGEDGAIHSIMGNDGRMDYALRAENGDGSNAHVHFLYKTCRSLECVDTTFAIPEMKGYAAESAQVLLMGTCRLCAQKIVEPRAHSAG